MNKNRKRLSKLLIPMLALSGANMDAMENAKPKTTIKTNLRHSKSQGKTISQEKTIKKLRPQLTQPGEVVKKVGKYEIQTGGEALDQLLSKYYLAHKNLKDEDISYGNSSLIVKHYKRSPSSEFIAVRKPIHNKNGFEAEKLYYDQYKTHGLDKQKWALKMYDQFEDKNTAYTVVERLKNNHFPSYKWHGAFKNKNGKTIKFPYTHIRTIVTTIKDYLDMLSYMNNAGIGLVDFHKENRVLEVKSPKNHRFVLADPGVFSHYTANDFNDYLFSDAEKALNFSDYFNSFKGGEGYYQQDTHETRKKCMERIQKGFDDAKKCLNKYFTFTDEISYRKIHNERRKEAKRILDTMVEDVEKIIKDDKSKKQ